MAFDYKKEYKEFYLPPKKPQIVEIPKMNFLAVRGQGNPNEEGGVYKDSDVYKRQIYMREGENVHYESSLPMTKYRIGPRIWRNSTTKIQITRFPQR